LRRRPDSHLDQNLRGLVAALDGRTAVDAVDLERFDLLLGHHDHVHDAGHAHARERALLPRHRRVVGARVGLLVLVPEGDVHAPAPSMPRRSSMRRSAVRVTSAMASPASRAPLSPAPTDAMLTVMGMVMVPPARPAPLPSSVVAAAAAPAASA